MKAYLATVDLVIRAGSWAEACDGLNYLLTASRIHDDTDPVLFDWAYVPQQKLGTLSEEIVPPDKIVAEAKALGNDGSFPECMGWLPDDAEEPTEQDDGAQTGDG